jgi:hypothetical protein
MNMIICLSQAPQNGWETWFSLNYGADLAKLCVKIPHKKPQAMKAALAEAKKDHDEKAKKADPKLPVTSATAIHKQNFEKAKFQLTVLETLNE